MNIQETVTRYINCKRKSCEGCELAEAKWEKIPVCRLLEEAQHAVRNVEVK